jgi:hypothetical protein
VEDAEPEPARDDRLAVVDAHVDVGCEARPVHDRRRLETARELTRGGEVVRVGVRVDDVADPEPRFRREREVAIHLAQLGIDEDRAAGLGATDEIGQTAAGADLLEDHRRRDSRTSVLPVSTSRREAQPTSQSHAEPSASVAIVTGRPTAK